MQKWREEFGVAELARLSAEEVLGCQIREVHDFHPLVRRPRAASCTSHATLTCVPRSGCWAVIESSGLCSCNMRVWWTRHSCRR